MVGVTDTYYSVTGVPTHVVKCGDLNYHTKVLALFIPGNPGNVTYYEEFMETLYEESGKTIPVWAVSHFGHTQTTIDSSKRPQSLQEQMQHKLDFIKEHIPKNVKLILIGHSIGAYLILNMLPSLPRERIIKCAQLFPCVERLAEIPFGWIFVPLFKYFGWILPLLLAVVYSLVPEILAEKIVQWCILGKTTHSCVLRAAMNLVNPKCMENFVNLAHDELQTLVEPDYDLIAKYSDKLWWYYGVGDPFCPLRYYSDMKNNVPQVDARVCQQGFTHTFPIKSGVPMARIVWREVMAPHADKCGCIITRL